ncbi:PREDICTED: uncharacterized protein LOC105366480 [Ceratosolen solmsi marchali]|uniref:Uncharacterized protein LOC105366480 n=1 Tax=Ceratosolen solmsi marchali TaxID=326594 RepID=A0AAJ6YS52_9HYME|nr:PREDICTED: uncharacterized protein LOC105366480 [Ceratosolen solmsi marchali]
MPRHEEEVELLGRDNSRDQVLAKGALKLLRAWQGPEFLGALLAGCLFSVGFIILALVPAILAFAQQHSNGSCRYNRATVGYSQEKSINVYFIKHENRTWTNEEFCAIETAAHHYPQYNIFIINLLINEEYISSKKKKILILNNVNSSETKLRYKLSEISNVNNIDISVDRFFARSIMSKGIKRLNSHKIELAAKFQVIWESSGIALEPLTILQLESVKHFINTNKIDKLASIQVDNDLQATTVPCQSFIGFVISQMTKVTFTDRQTLLKHALMDFCRSSMDCVGIRILKPFSQGLPKLSCSTLDSLINTN